MMGTVSGVNFEALVAWMDDQGLEAGPVHDVKELRGGTQNVMLRFTRGRREFALRRGPTHLRARSNDTLRREIHLLSALGATNVAHPRMIASCLDETEFDGAVFYLMEPLDGFNAASEVPALHAGSAEVRNQMGLSMAERLSALAQVDHEAVGLGEFGQPKGLLKRQVPKWLGEHESYQRHDSYRGPGLPNVERVAEWLERHRPEHWRPGIMHGDFHVANVMFSPKGPEVVAIVDWEMATISDPLLDLGWLLATWPGCGGPEHTMDGLLGRAGGLPTKDELLQRCADQSDRDLSAIEWGC